MQIQLYSYKGDSKYDIFEPFDSGIRLVTSSIYSHNELVINGVSYSSLALDGATERIRYFDPNKWDMIEIDTSKIDIQNLNKVIAESKNAPYDWLGIARFIFPSIEPSKTAYFCSERCADMLGIPFPHLYSPGQLHDYCKHNLGFNHA